MNKLYFATVYDIGYGFYISAENLKEAKKIARGISDLNLYDYEFTDLRCKCAYKGGKIRRTEQPTGQLTIKQQMDEGLAWWECPECDGENFTYISDEEYKCNDCGGIFNIPYCEY